MNSTNNKTDIVYDGQFYLKDNGGIFITYFALSTLGAFVGTAGNVLILATILLNKKLRVNPAYMLMVNLSLSDFAISLVVHTFTDIGVFLGEEYYLERNGLCVFVAATCLISCGASLANMGMLAVNRYINICHHGLYKKIFSFKKTLVFCGLAWVAGVIIDLPNFVGWGGHFFDPKSAGCIWNRLASHSYAMFYPITAIFIPCICIFICYLRIFIFTRNAKSKVSTGKENQSLKVARSLFASFALFAICWVPYGLIVSIDYADMVPMSYHAFTTLLAHVNSALNPVFYILLNPVFRSSFLEIIGKCLKRANRLNVVDWEKSRSYQNTAN